jgi:hypothetical protein
MAAPNLTDTIRSIQAQQTQAAQLRNEKEIAERLAAITRTSPLTEQELVLCKAFMEWTKRKEVKYFPASPTTIAAYLTDIAGHKTEDYLVDSVSAFRRLHDQNGLANPCATFAVEQILAVLIKTEPPRSWPKAEQLLFTALSPTLRAIISRREKERETGLRRQQNKLAEEIKKLQPQPQQEIDDMSKKQGWEKGVGKASPSETGVKHISTPKDNAPGRDISSTLDKNQSGGSAALTRPPSWNKN